MRLLEGQELQRQYPHESHAFENADEVETELTAICGYNSVVTVCDFHQSLSIPSA